MANANPIPRRRRWPFILIAVAVGLAALWTAVWNYGAGVAERTIADWKVREAQAGRVYSCATQSIGGFPFGIEVRCADAGAVLRSNEPPFQLKARDMLVTASVWQPTALTTEIASPLTVSDPGGSAGVTARWRHAQTEVRGLPTSPESVAIRIEQPLVDRTPDGQRLFTADRVEIDGRMVSGTVWDHPVVEIVLKLGAASASSWHPAAATSVDADIAAVLRGLKDFAPKPWPVRLRELQAAGGRIEISHARLRQRDTIATASGTLRLTPAGRLDGELRLTVANLEKFLPSLGLDKMLAPEAASPELNKTFGALDRIMPGLGNVARKNAAPALAAGIAVMGQPAELEGQRAVTLPLRFNDGAVSLGPVLVGQIPPVF